MNNDTKVIKLTHRQFCEAVSVVESIRSVNEAKDDLDECMCMMLLTTELLKTMHVNNDGVTVKLETEDRFKLWLCIDLYKQFLLATQPDNVDEISSINALMACIGGPNKAE